MWYHATQNHGEVLGIGGRIEGTGFQASQEELVDLKQLLRTRARHPPARATLASMLGAGVTIVLRAKETI